MKRSLVPGLAHAGKGISQAQARAGPRIGGETAKFGRGQRQPLFRDYDLEADGQVLTGDLDGLGLARLKGTRQYLLDNNQQGLGQLPGLSRRQPHGAGGGLDIGGGDFGVRRAGRDGEGGRCAGFGHGIVFLGSQGNLGTRTMGM